MDLIYILKTTTDVLYTVFFPSFRNRNCSVEHFVFFGWIENREENFYCLHFVTWFSIESTFSILHDQTHTFNFHLCSRWMSRITLQPIIGSTHSIDCKLNFFIFFSKENATNRSYWEWKQQFFFSFFLCADCMVRQVNHISLNK